MTRMEHMGHKTLFAHTARRVLHWRGSNSQDSSPVLCTMVSDLSSDAVGEALACTRGSRNPRHPHHVHGPPPPEPFVPAGLARPAETSCSRANARQNLLAEQADLTH
jgi:hypothetical protein